jgi:hypothetical protein
MNQATRSRPRMTAVARAAGTLAVAGSTLTTFGVPAASAAGPTTTGLAASAPGRPTGPASSAPGSQKRLYLDAMPEGIVTPTTEGAKIDAFGFTPNSAHAVELVPPQRGPRMIGRLGANGVGQASGLFHADVRDGSRLLILDGEKGTVPISTTPPLDVGVPRELYPVSYGRQLWGDVTVGYDSRTDTVTLTVDAFGLTPGEHAAHIHSGSCYSQGPVVYTLRDFVADADGNIIDQTRVVSGVTHYPASGWYFNLHQGNAKNILRNGQPAIGFRPLLCANI